MTSTLKWTKMCPPGEGHYKCKQGTEKDYRGG